MLISLNGNTHEVEANTLADALTLLGYGNAVIATAINGQFVPTEVRKDRQLSEGDEIEIVAPMQGG